MGQPTAGFPGADLVDVRDHSRPLNEQISISMRKESPVAPKQKPDEKFTSDGKAASSRTISIEPAIDMMGSILAPFFTQDGPLRRSDRAAASTVLNWR